jgi:hypothetical protein
MTQLHLKANEQWMVSPTTKGRGIRKKKKKKKKKQNTRNNVNGHHGRTTMQHPIYGQIPRCEPKDLNNSETEPNLTSWNNLTNTRMRVNRNRSASEKVMHEEHKTYSDYSEW